LASREQAEAHSKKRREPISSEGRKDPADHGLLDSTAISSSPRLGEKIPASGAEGNPARRASHDSLTKLEEKCKRLQEGCRPSNERSFGHRFSSLELRQPGRTSASGVSMITIKDVARAAGVSVATVSRVQNGSALVKDATRRRVGEVADRLGYSPHGAARSLITSRTNTLGVVLPDIYGEFFSEVIRGIDQTASRHGYHLLVSSSHEDRSAVESALRSMRGRVDGLIVMWPEADPTSVLKLPAGVAAVLLGAPVDPDGFDVIRIANFEGAHRMVCHLLDQGHRRIAIIKGIEENADAVERLRAYRAALAEAGLSSRAIEVPGDFSEASGYHGAHQLLRGKPTPTAVFAANDAMAIGALSALREAGLRVPEDIALAGFDDIPMARYMDPALSTVHVDISALGELATLRLLAALRDKQSHEHRVDTLPTTLLLRRSTGVAAAGQASTPAAFDSPPHSPS
jgi:LacI family transcriptional regulator